MTVDTHKAMTGAASYSSSYLRTVPGLGRVSKAKGNHRAKMKGKQSIGNLVPETVIPRHRSESRAKGKSRASLLGLRENYGGHPDGG